MRERSTRGRCRAAVVDGRPLTEIPGSRPEDLLFLRLELVVGQDTLLLQLRELLELRDVVVRQRAVVHGSLVHRLVGFRSGLVLGATLPGVIGSAADRSRAQQGS